MRHKILNRTRFTIVVVIAMLMMVLLCNLILNICEAHAETKAEAQYVEVEISYGDTLWEIAKVYMPGSKDINKSIYQICKLNNITASTLYPGMIILVPINN